MFDELASFLIAAFALTGSLFAGAAFAQDTNVVGDLEIIGRPKPHGIGFQPAATGIASDVHWLDGMVLLIIAVITVFVVGLLAYVILRFNSRSNPTPAKFTHNSPLEIAWTVVPILILIFIGAFSLPVLFNQQEIPEGDVVVKATGYQWYWGYEYPEHDLAFDSYMIGSPATGGDYTLTAEVEATAQAARAEAILADAPEPHQAAPQGSPYLPLNSLQIQPKPAPI